ncbi:MAG: hypothetical protein VBE63_26005 [Lamprobacter sp.]|uniref:hypothetical protein n=1 Tax=Lamprobacter sp. TaxID=3100796 RepID=UPI002B25845D|nr:hypothetical protein [Lamprobacter sp.]MEA3643362.1 hypothetical protein [Lamprobacter sp.]
MQYTKKICRGVFQYLPSHAREFALSQFSNRNNPSGPGDGYVYEWVVENPPSLYIGPLPYVSSLRRIRRYQNYPQGF